MHGEFDGYLTENFSCLPVYLDDACHNDFYKHYLWPLVHYLLLPSSAHNGNLRFDAGTYRIFLAMNM